MPLIKVIVPVYKTEKYLKRCINSILSQTERRFELILINDGSPDSCAQICEYYAERDSRIHVINQKNQGLSVARNVGLQYKSNCKYITFIDSDDWIHPQYFEMLLQAAENTKCKVVIVGHLKVVREVQITKLTNMTLSVYSPEECYCLTSISTTPIWGKLYKSELFNDLKFPVGKIHEDYYITWKILFKLKEIAVINTPMYYYFKNPEGIMHNSSMQKHMDLFPALEEKIDFFHLKKYFNAENRALTKMFKMLDKYIVYAESDSDEVKKQLILVRKKYIQKYKRLLKKQQGED